MKMRKRVLAVVVVMAMTISMLVGCGTDGKGGDGDLALVTSNNQDEIVETEDAQSVTDDAQTTTDTNEADVSVTEQVEDEMPAEGTFGAIVVPEEAKTGTFIEKTWFDNLPAINVTSENLHDCVWDSKLANTSNGENCSPQLSWDAVEGAKSYAVFMIDGGWMHMDVYTEDTSIPEGVLKSSPRGYQYVGPYPPGGETHTYTIFVFALKNDVGKVKFLFNSGNSIDLIYQGHDTDIDGNTGNVIAAGRLDGTYTDAQ